MIFAFVPWDADQNNLVEAFGYQGSIVVTS